MLKKYVPPQVHTLGSPFTWLPATAVDKLPEIPTMIYPTDFDIHACAMAHVIMIK